MRYYESSDINTYIKKKLKMLSEFGIVINDNIRNEILSMTIKSDVDRRCRTIIENHTDMMNEIDRNTRLYRR